MTTHFLVGKTDNHVMEPQDEFCSLPLEGGVHNGVSTADIGVNDFTSSSTEKTFTQANDPKSSQICSILWSWIIFNLVRGACPMFLCLYIGAVVFKIKERNIFLQLTIFRYSFFTSCNFFFWFHRNIFFLFFFCQWHSNYFFYKCFKQTKKWHKLIQYVVKNYGRMLRNMVTLEIYATLLLFSLYRRDEFQAQHAS